MLTKATIAAALLLAGCTPAPQRENAADPPPGSKTACHAGGDARGIAAGFFALFTDGREGCL